MNIVDIMNIVNTADNMNIYIYVVDRCKYVISGTKCLERGEQCCVFWYRRCFG